MNDAWLLALVFVGLLALVGVGIVFYTIVQFAHRCYRILTTNDP